MEDDFAEITVAIVVDQDGDFAIAEEAEDATERYGENYGGGLATSLFKLTLKVPKPKAIEIVAALPKSEDGSYSLVIQS
ncbi:MAG: hypothetical protein WAN43_01240 [Rhodomicrobium sp.]